MFSDFEEIGDEIYVYKNFLSEEECSLIVNSLDNFPKEDWEINEFNNLPTIQNFKELNLVYDKLNNILPEHLYLAGQQLTAVIMEKFKTWPEHYDSDYLQGIKKAMSSYKEGMEYIEKSYCVYGSIVYLNDFNGGEIYYPNQNIEYKPNKGDLVIHSSEIKCLHGVKMVRSSKRYTYANLIYTKVRVPI